MSFRRELNATIVGEADSAETAKSLFESTRLDVAIVDLQLSPGDAFEACNHLRARQPTAKVVLISSRLADYTVLRIEMAEPDGLLDKNTDCIENLVAAVRELEGGGRYFSPSFLAAKRRRHECARSFDKFLSDRECTILSYIGQFRSNDEIGAILEISPMTVQTHRSRMMRKLRLNCTLKLVRYALEHGFSEPSSAHSELSHRD